MEKDVRGSKGLDILYPLYKKFRTLWSMSPFPPEIPSHRVKYIFEKEKETKSMIEIRDILRNIFLASVPYIEDSLTDFTLGFVDQFKKRGENIGEFVATFYQEPGKVATSILKYTAEYLAHIASNPFKFAGKGIVEVYEWFGEYKDDIIKSQGEGFAFDMGRSVAIAIMYTFLRKMPKTIKAPMFAATHTEKVDFSLKTQERTHELFVSLISRIFKNSKLNEEETQIIAGSFSKNLLKKTKNVRDKIYLTLLKYYLSDQKSLPSENNLSVTLDFLLESLYDRTVKTKIGEKRLCEILKSIPTNDAIDSQKLEITKQEEAEYSGRVSGEMFAYFLSKKYEKVSGEKVDKGKEQDIIKRLSAVYKDFNKNKLPNKKETMEILKLLFGFRYHLAKQIQDPDAEVKMIYVLMKNLNEGKRMQG